ncbi:MAG: O-antigen ligase family protein [Bacillus sp. (in: firmicutes)]
MMNKEKMIHLLILFIAIQPIIDVLTTFSIEVLNTGATFGLFIRVAYMILSTIFILSQVKQSALAKKSFYYLIFVGIFIIANLTVSYFYKPHFYLFSEVKFMVKTYYIVITFISLLLVLQHFRKTNTEEKKLFLNVFVISSLTIGMVMVVSILTNTSLSSYDWTKVGYVGWFSAGNEIGAICAIMLPVLSYYAISKTTSIKTIYAWIPFVLIGFSLVMFGTKVGFLALIGVLLVTIIILLISITLKKNKSAKKGHLLNFGISLFLLLSLIISTPFTPIYKNTFAHLSLLGIEFNQSDEITDQTETDPSQNDSTSTSISNDQLENLILSSREIFLKTYKELHSEAPLSQKLFGMGYGGNFTQEPKMIEMDYFDIFYSFGIIGSILYFLPFVVAALYTLRFFIQNIGLVFTPKYALLLSSVMLILGIAFLAGHVFTAPAVSIYVAFIVAYLLTDLKSAIKSAQLNTLP